jgi:hypothetical protein
MHCCYVLEQRVLDQLSVEQKKCAVDWFGVLGFHSIGIPI